MLPVASIAIVRCVRRGWPYVGLSHATNVAATATAGLVHTTAWVTASHPTVLDLRAQQVAADPGQSLVLVPYVCVCVGGGVLTESC
jgi:hypothetical protein